MLPPEDRRASTGVAFLCAAAAQTWGHDAFVSKPMKEKTSKTLEGRSATFRVQGLVFCTFFFNFGDSFCELDKRQLSLQCSSDMTSVKDGGTMLSRRS